MSRMGRSQQGFGILYGLLITLILVAAGATGWYVWRSANSTPKATDQTNSATTQLLAVCYGLSNTYQGGLYTAPGGTYRFCVPDGWKVYWNGDKTSSSLIGSSQDLGYKERVSPVIAKGGGTDGPFPFLVTYNNFDEATFAQEAAGFTMTGSVSADGINGTAYYHLTGTNDPIGAGVAYLTQGTKQYLFTFYKDTKTVEFRYNVAPDESNQIKLVENVVSTLKLND